MRPRQKAFANELVCGANETQQESKILHLLQALPCFELDISAADEASAIRRTLERTGQPIGMADSLFAGIVVSRAASLSLGTGGASKRLPVFGSSDSSGG